MTGATSGTFWKVALKSQDAATVARVGATRLAIGLIMADGIPRWMDESDIEGEAFRFLALNLQIEDMPLLTWKVCRGLRTYIGAARSACNGVITIDERPESETVFNRQVSAGIDHLPPQERVVMTGIYYDGLTQEAVARQMGISPDRVFLIHKAAIGKIKDSGAIAVFEEDEREPAGSKFRVRDKSCNPSPSKGYFENPRAWRSRYKAIRGVSRSTVVTVACKERHDFSRWPHRNPFGPLEEMREPGGQREQWEPAHSQYWERFADAYVSRSRIRFSQRARAIRAKDAILRVTPMLWAA